MPRPVFLLDVDGVINAKRPGWGAAPRRGFAYAKAYQWRMRWAPALIDRIRGIHTSGAADVVWCTTWCPWADQLERLFRLPVLGRAFAHELAPGPEGWADKRAAARDLVAAGAPLVWADDEAIPDPYLCGDYPPDRALLVRPDPRRGLQPTDMDAIDTWLKGWA